MIYGWDISTSFVGVSIFHDDFSYFESRYLDLRKKDSLIDKAYAFESFAKIIHNEFPNHEHHHYVEDRLGGFSFGKTMQQTLLKLAAFNAITMFIIHYVFIEEYDNGKIVGSIESLHPSTVKSIMKKQGLVYEKGDKKQATLEFVCKLEDSFPITINKNKNVNPWCYDMADSYCIAFAGIKKFYKKE